MRKTKVAISLDANTLSRLDGMVRSRLFANRSRAIEAAVQEKLERVERNRLATECAKLDPLAEAALAEEGLELSSWPEY